MLHAGGPHLESNMPQRTEYSKYPYHNKHRTKRHNKYGLILLHSSETWDSLCPGRELTFVSMSEMPAASHVSAHRWFLNGTPIGFVSYTTERIHVCATKYTCWIILNYGTDRICKEAWKEIKISWLKIIRQRLSYTSNHLNQDEIFVKHRWPRSQEGFNNACIRSTAKEVI